MRRVLLVPAADKQGHNERSQNENDDQDYGQIGHRVEQDPVGVPFSFEVMLTSSLKTAHEDEAT